jgi:hypothetical protein
MLVSGLGEIYLPNEECRLWIGGAPSHKLLQEEKLEDLFLWNLFEISRTLIGSQALRFMSDLGRKVRKNLPFSNQAWRGLQAFVRLFPEWPKSPYMRIPQQERKRRIGILFGDVPLALEPRLDEIPKDLYQRLALQIFAGGPAALRGSGPTDLVLIKIPRLLPMEHCQKLVNGYIKLLYAGTNFDGEIRISGRGGLFSRRRYELELVGKYRLFETNGFNLARTLAAAHQNPHKRDDSYYKARKFISHLIRKRWTIFEPFFSLIGGGPPLGE